VRVRHLPRQRGALTATKATFEKTRCNSLWVAPSYTHVRAAVSRARFVELASLASLATGWCDGAENASQARPQVNEPSHPTGRDSPFFHDLATRAQHTLHDDCVLIDNSFALMLRYW
jgi:hypothetical protein